MVIKEQQSMPRPVFIMFILIFLFSFPSCQDKEVITVFHAGSLSIPLHEIAELYQSSHPDVIIRLEGAGSLTCIRKITELKKPCDVLAVADYALIDELMIPDYASYNVLFAGNRLAVGYNDAAKWGNQINSENWHGILLRDDVHFGRSDPDQDPSGYRTEIMAGLAERLYQVPGFQKELLEKDRKYIRPKGTELLPLLEVGAIDFVFHYQSVLMQHGLEILPLSDSLNLANPELNHWYETECVSVKGSTQNENINKCGEAMAYGICLPHNGKNASGAEDFLKFLITRGREVLEKNGQPTFKPAFSQKSMGIPDWFKKLNF
jgi:molybdate/tungstate transport system substrate-binding protein